MDDNLREYLMIEGYSNLREIEGRGICGILRFAFTTALVYGIDRIGYEGRYCYKSIDNARLALDMWTGEGDPPDKLWIKHKGRTEYSNPKTITDA